MPDRFIDEARHHPGKPGKPAILAGCGGPWLRVRPGPGRGVAAIRLTHPEPGRVHRRQSQQGEHGGHATHERTVTGGGAASVKLEKFLAVNTLLGHLKTAFAGTYHSLDFAKYAHR